MSMIPRELHDYLNQDSLSNLQTQCLEFLKSMRDFQKMDTILIFGGTETEKNKIIAKLRGMESKQSAESIILSPSHRTAPISGLPTFQVDNSNSLIFCHWPDPIQAEYSNFVLEFQHFLFEALVKNTRNIRAMIFLVNYHDLISEVRGQEFDDYITLASQVLHNTAPGNNDLNFYNSIYFVVSNTEPHAKHDEIHDILSDFLKLENKNERIKNYHKQSMISSGETVLSRERKQEFETKELAERRGKRQQEWVEINSRVMLICATVWQKSKNVFLWDTLGELKNSKDLVIDGITLINLLKGSQSIPIMDSQYSPIMRLNYIVQKRILERLNACVLGVLQDQNSNKQGKSQFEREILALVTQKSALEQSLQLCKIEKRLGKLNSQQQQDLDKIFAEINKLEEMANTETTQLRSLEERLEKLKKELDALNEPGTTTVTIRKEAKAQAWLNTMDSIAHYIEGAGVVPSPVAKPLGQATVELCKYFLRNRAKISYQEDTTFGNNAFEAAAVKYAEKVDFSLPEYSCSPAEGRFLLVYSPKDPNQSGWVEVEFTVKKSLKNKPEIDKKKAEIDAFHMQIKTKTEELKRISGKMANLRKIANEIKNNPSDLATTIQSIEQELLNVDNKLRDCSKLQKETDNQIEATSDLIVKIVPWIKMITLLGKYNLFERNTKFDELFHWIKREPLVPNDSIVPANNNQQAEPKKGLHWAWKPLMWTGGAVAAAAVVYTAYKKMKR